MSESIQRTALFVFLGFWSVTPLWFANLFIQDGQYRLGAWLVATPAAITIALVLVWIFATMEPPEEE